MRLRFKDISDRTLNEDEEDGPSDETAVEVIKQVQDAVLNDLTLKGFEQISKVYAKKY